MKNQTPADGYVTLNALTPVSDIMTTPVKCATPGTSIDSLTGFFLDDRISAVPVIDAQGKPIGVVSKTDLLERYFRIVSDDMEETLLPRLNDDEQLALEIIGDGVRIEDTRGKTVEEIMTPMMLSVGMDVPIKRAAGVMNYEGVHRVAVTDKKGTIVGIVTSMDILRWVANA